MANSAKKGTKYQRKVAKALSKWTGLEFKSTPRSGGLRWNTMSHVIGDIVCITEGLFFPFTIECKFYEKIDFSQALLTKTKKNQIAKFWQQASSDGERAKKVPLLIFRYNGLPGEFQFLAMDYKDYLKLKRFINTNEPSMVIKTKSPEYGNYKLYLTNLQAFTTSKSEPLIKKAQKLCEARRS